MISQPVKIALVVVVGIVILLVLILAVSALSSATAKIGNVIDVCGGAAAEAKTGVTGKLKCIPALLLFTKPQFLPIPGR